MKTVKFIKDFKGPGKQFVAEGEENLVTDKHATWLAAQGYTDPVKKEAKEDKKAAKRETK